MDWNWKPIDRKAKNGKAYLVTNSVKPYKCTDLNTVVAAWWRHDGPGRNGRWVCYMDLSYDPTCPFEPTHYMPLPDPPHTVVSNSPVTAPEQSEPRRV